MSYLLGGEYKMLLSSDLKKKKRVGKGTIKRDL